ncbi:unnamed protein product, partial [Rotaria magnacalcarata]
PDFSSTLSTNTTGKQCSNWGIGRAQSTTITNTEQHSNQHSNWNINRVSSVNATREAKPNTQYNRWNNDQVSSMTVTREQEELINQGPSISSTLFTGSGTFKIVSVGLLVGILVAAIPFSILFTFYEQDLAKK